MNTIQDYLEHGERLFTEHALFFGHGTDSAWDEAVALVSFVMDLPPDADRSVLELSVTAEQAKQIETLFNRRIEDRIPAPYLTGTAWFCGLPFHVDERVIIPRSPFAELIVEGFQPWLETAPKRVLDLCCGSGCIGIAAGYAFENAHITLLDISEDALAVAQQNVVLHHIHDRINLVQSDGLQALKDQQFDLIISNPPYVDANDFASMPAEYKHEPELALVSGNDGLDFTRTLLQQAQKHLSDNGWLFVEVGNSWEALERDYPDVPFTWIEFAYGGHGVFCLSKQQLQQYFPV